MQARANYRHAVQTIGNTEDMIRSARHIVDEKTRQGKEAIGSHSSRQ